ncbi:MAG: hypothetical protein JWM96_42 [Alphaproteobacteria bacterium]|nr:hypothetical protein [Alphaproteobacteria bacterium]
MKTITCKHCGTHNGYNSHFCEACGKRVRKSGQGGDSMMLLIIILVLIAGGALAYYMGYRFSDLMALLGKVK